MKDHDQNGKGKAAGAAVGAAVGGVAAGATTGALAGGLTGPVGAALGAVVGAVVGAVTGHGAKAAHETKADPSAREPRLDSTTQQHGSVHTVIGAFDDRNAAQRAVDRLVQSGFPRHDVHLEHGSAAQGSAAGGNAGFFPGLFEMDHDEGRVRNAQHGVHAHTYDEAVRRGSAVVVVDTHAEADADRASSLLHEAGAIDVDERAKQWRAEGWNPPAAPAAGRSLTGTQARGDQGQVLDVVQEELQVGKRTMDRGGVRVVQRVSSRPVHELVKLREERAVVDRRAVDRPASAQELADSRGATLEVRESVEEPVVAKTARVVEEVRVGKEVREREQAVEDTVRRKDVEVQRMAGSGALERDRAVAADDASRDPLRRDKPTR
jgi:uncharacterized protein (TIGR02271 family)